MRVEQAFMSAVQRGKPAASATEVKLCAIQQLTNHFQNAVGRFDERFFRAALASVEVRASGLVRSDYTSRKEL